MLLTSLDAIPRDRLDWTLAEILPHINGVNFAKKIAVNADVGLDLVLKALRCTMASASIFPLDARFLASHHPAALAVPRRTVYIALLNASCCDSAVTVL